MEYRIDDLARAAGMTTRNVRAYQNRGLLPPPRRAGRVAIYDDTHLARLKLIGSMLGRGYGTAHIAEMLTAWEHGKDLADVLGLEAALGRPWGELPRTVSLARARKLAGDKASFDRLVHLGLIKAHGGKATLTRPALLEAFAEMRGYGMRMASVVDLHEAVQPLIDEVARKLVAAAVGHFAATKGPDWVPGPDELPELTAELARFRQLAVTSVHGTLAAAMERETEAALGSYLALLAKPAADADAG